ncbi:MAG: metallophosphoesterase [Candidatus Pacebacteria bacterium]|nr:metallophosphoesterase [Candidatus Paceibacterota bacterium]
MFYTVVSFMLLFLFIALGIFLAGNLIITAFSLVSRNKKLFVYLLVCLSVFFFIISLPLINTYSSTLAILFHIIAALLLGLSSQLMLFGLLFYLISFFKFKKKLLAKIALGLSLIFFLLGLYNAFYPRVKTIVLDDWLKENKVVHLSDLHLGYFHGVKYLDRVVKKVNSLEADVVIISGDLFDGNDKDIAKFIESLSKFKNPTIFVYGNHDVYLSDESVGSVISQAGLMALSDEARVINDLEIIGFDYLSREDSNIRRKIDNLLVEKTYPRIVVNHVPVDRAEAKALEANLMLSGHAHRGQIFPLSLIVRLMYGKYSYGLENYEGMSTYTSAGTGTWGPPLRTLFPGEIIFFQGIK